MYAHTQGRASRPSTVPSSIYSSHHYGLAAQTGSGLPYDATDDYPPIRAAPLSIPRFSSSSLAAALDPAPEPDYNRASVSSSSSVENSDERLDPSAFDNLCAASSAGSAEYQTIMYRQVPDSSRSLGPQFQHYQNDDGHRRTTNRPQSLYSGTNASLAPTSDTYVLSHPPTFIEPEEPRWPPGMPFTGYSNVPTLPPNAPIVASPSGFPVFPDTFSPASIGDIYGVSGAAEWTYMSASASLQAQAPHGMYLGVGTTSPSMGAGMWFDSSLDEQVRIQPESSLSFLDQSASRQRYEPSSDSATGVNPGPSNSGSNASDGASDYLGQRQAVQQNDHNLGDSVTTVQEQQQFSPRRPVSSAQESYTRVDSCLSGATLPVVSNTGLPAGASLRGQRVSERSLQLQGHDASMPPPPLPARVHAPVLDRRDSTKRPSQPNMSRRHSVAVPPGINGTNQSRDASPTSSLASASVRPSSAAPESSSSSTLSNDDITATPRLATLSLNDAAWALDQKVKRSALSETFRLVHGRDPPEEMRILETTAIERSVKNDAVLLGSPIEGKVLQSDGAARSGENSSEQSVQNKKDAAGGIQRPPISSEEMSDEEVFSQPLVGWTLARAGCEIGASTMLGTDELVTSDGIRRPYPFAAPANPSIGKILSVIRHDAHLPTHISGLGTEAYDGRSYLPDECERGDLDHVPLPSPGARSGDHPALAAFLPHPLAKRGENWHELTNPAPISRKSFDKRKHVEEARGGDSDDKEEDTDEDSIRKNLEKNGVKKEEEGEGWGFPEGGSHGPQLMNPGKDKGGPNTRQKLKLSTEKKTPPKMACHFCRNRKIACGASKCGDPTICNQCERRNLRCIFPTVSRRGMRTRGPRSAHTVDGTDEIDKDSVEREESSEASEVTQDPEAGPSVPSSSKKTRKAKKSSDKGTREKEATKGKGRGKGKKKANASPERQEGPSGQTDDVVEMDDNDPGGSEMDVDRVSGHEDDPLAPLAAEMEWSRRRESLTMPSPLQFDTSPSMGFSTAPSSMSTSSLSAAFQFPQTTFENSFPASVPGDAYALHVGPSPGPFTTTPLQRRNASGDASGPCP